MKKIIGSDVDYKCLSCGEIGIISYRFPLCNKCLNFWGALDESFNRDGKAFDKLNPLFSFLQKDGGFASIRRNNEIAKSPSRFIELGIGSKTKKTFSKPKFHYIVLTPFEIDKNYKRNFGDYLCRYETDNHEINFVDNESNICSACLKRLTNLKTRFSLIMLKNEKESYDSYHYYYKSLIEQLYKFYKAKI